MTNMLLWKQQFKVIDKCSNAAYYLIILKGLKNSIICFRTETSDDR